MRDEYKIMLVAWVLVGIWIALVIFWNRKTHPKALFFLFMVEMWERFSYYGMRGILVLYLTSRTITGGFDIDSKSALGVYAAYAALVYLTPLLGGFLADKLMGFRKSIIWGAILMAAGQFTLSLSSGDQILSKATSGGFSAIVGETIAAAVPGTANIFFLYTGLALLVLGNGFFKPNISSVISKFYPAGDPRRDGAFTIFYMGINIGAFLTPLTCGAIGEIEGWSYGFLCAGIGMVVGLCIFLYTASHGYLEHHAEPPPDAIRSIGGFNPNLLVYLGTILLVPICGMLIHWNAAMDVLLGVIGLAAIIYMIVISLRYETVERQRIWVIVVLFFFSAIFWTFFELAGSALNLFTDTNVEKSILGWTLQTSMFQSVNAFFIMLFAPLFAWIWVKLSRKNLEPAAPVKFAFGLFLLGAGFLVLNLGRAAAVDAMVPAMFLILLYLLHTLGELSLSPVGLSLVTKLAPAKVVGFMMGFWLLSSSIAQQAGKWVGQATKPPEGVKLSPTESMEFTLNVFNNIGLVAIGAGVVLILLSPIIKRWMHGIK